MTFMSTALSPTAALTFQLIKQQGQWFLTNLSWIVERRMKSARWVTDF